MKPINLNHIYFLVVSLSFVIFISLNKRLDTIEAKVDKITEIMSPEDTTYKSTYNKILPKITAFNNQTDSLTVKRLAKVMHHYQLDKTDKSTKMLVGQILQESGGSHYYKSGHPKEGKLLISDGGAIGIAQITPTTALGYMTTVVTDEDIKDMRRLGCADFSFVKQKISVNEKMSLVRKWLKGEKNNLTLWGYIMHDLFKRSKDIDKALVCYNAGIGGMQMYLDSGNVITNHEYIVSIKSKLARLSGL